MSEDELFALPDPYWSPGPCQFCGQAVNEPMIVHLVQYCPAIPYDHWRDYCELAWERIEEGDRDLAGWLDDTDREAEP